MPKSVNAVLASSLALLCMGSAMVVFAPQRREGLLPLVKKRTLISDRIFGGGSDVGLENAQQGIRFRYGLSPVSSHPWAGLNLAFTDSLQGSIDLGRWERLEIRASCTRHRPLRIQILSDDQPSGSASRDSAHPIYHAMEFSPDGSRASFGWSVFTIPAWWREQNARTEVQRLDLLDRFRAIEFHSGDSPSGRDSSVVEILELDLVGPNRLVQAVGWGLVFFAACGLAAVFWSRRRTSSGSPMVAAAVLVPDQVVLDDPRARQRDQLVQKLGETFADPELSLESFAAAQGLSSRLVAALIKEATQLHFKGALNELRLTEAARLLKETRGNVSEIAYAVGFQNASHFGRAFREKFGVSPSDYRTAERPPEIA